MRIENHCGLCQHIIWIMCFEWKIVVHVGPSFLKFSKNSDNPTKEAWLIQKLTFSCSRRHTIFVAQLSNWAKIPAWSNEKLTKAGLGGLGLGLGVGLGKWWVECDTSAPADADICVFFINLFNCHHWQHSAIENHLIKSMPCALWKFDFAQLMRLKKKPAQLHCMQLGKTQSSTIHILGKLQPSFDTFEDGREIWFGHHNSY